MYFQGEVHHKFPHTVLRHIARIAGVMVWGAIAYDSRFTLIVMRGILTDQRYVDDISAKTADAIVSLCT
ncbi:hypothetical protein TNCV_585451 [Trichonephila clavipes]|nr:hypothetical protein TNCV_585451 [Trichonephila clavipes]